MLKILRSITLILSFTLIFCIACSGLNTENDLEKANKNLVSQTTDIPPQLKIMTSTPILADWVNQITDNQPAAKSIIPYGIDPHSYNPGAKDIASIAKSDLVFTIGLNYEPQPLSKFLANHPEIKQVHLINYISPIHFNSKDTHKHEHDENEPDNYDPHFWFDPTRVIFAIDTIAEELSILNPSDTNRYQTRASEYTVELENLDTYIRESISKIPKDQRNFMTVHESLGYLTNRYDLNVVHAVIPNLDSTIGINPQNLVNATKLIQENDIQVIFLENDTSNKSAKTVANETGIKVVTGLNVETLSNKSQTYIDFMKNNTQIIVENLQKYVRR